MQDDDILPLKTCRYINSRNLCQTKHTSQEFVSDSTYILGILYQTEHTKLTQKEFASDSTNIHPGNLCQTLHTYILGICVRQYKHTSWEFVSDRTYIHPRNLCQTLHTYILGICVRQYKHTSWEFVSDRTYIHPRNLCQTLHTYILGICVRQYKHTTQEFYVRPTQPILQESTYNMHLSHSSQVMNGQPHLRSLLWQSNKRNQGCIQDCTSQVALYIAIYASPIGSNPSVKSLRTFNRPRFLAQWLGQSL